MFVRVAQKLYRVARSLAATDGQAREVVEAAVIEGYRRLERFRGDARPSTWLARIVMTAAVLRAERRPWPMALADRVVGLFDAPPRREEDTDKESLDGASALERVLEELSPGLRLPFVLSEVERMSVAECADCLRLSEEQVRVRLFRARAAVARRCPPIEYAPALDEVYAFPPSEARRLWERIAPRLEPRPAG